MAAAKGSSKSKSKAHSPPKKKEEEKPTPPPVQKGSGIPIPDPPVKDENYDETIKVKKGKKAPPVVGTAPKAPNPTSVELKLEELDEKLLRASYKEKCAHYKAENEWYRNEIESTEKDTTEYIRYLLNKKDEKQATIDSLQDGKKKDTEVFAQKRRDREAYNRIKIEELKNVIIELELKLESKQQDMMGLSDIISKRSRHEAEIIKIRQDIIDSDRAHNEKVAILERSLLETRIKLQREADLKIQEMENAAQEKATNYLKEHAAAMEVENIRLEAELRRCITNTQELLKKKELIERENHDLEREQIVREDLLKLRISKVMDSQAHEKNWIFQSKPESSESALRLATANSQRGKKSYTSGTQDRPVLKLVVMAGSGKAEAEDAKAAAKESARAMSVMEELAHKWEISDGSDDEFL
ncbi:hypothetical protein BCR33DRAFT_723452 [Rhizoclosmatium globosum]|uniref:Uncharacterized protein n=1 Tax=Rhizoclosmatium globosum TaxID=329046 RepID=A0A1Y2BEB4_9FUNG|nr:hypothetical protein BCR33DRAFT_723452 [Rhizoclosmatium globosum]|eukprot:ORY32415.1 hypothetical protein BCR33DRAFT_723452 [Rhizoclosmatium globosum]